MGRALEPGPGPGVGALSAGPGCAALGNADSSRPGAGKAQNITLL